MSIAQKSLAIIAVAAVAVAVVFSFVATIQVASAATNGCPHTWAVNLKVGSTGADVMALQQLLNSDSATMVASTGAGSPGMESTYFGAKTKAAVIAFQNKYASQVLTPVGLTAGTGFFGASSRAQANGLCSGTVTPSPSPTPAAGTGLTVAAGTQPAATLAPQGASRVPFTTFTLTAGNDGDVTVSSVTVQRTGLGADAAFSGVILIDQDTGMQIGTAKTFNSNHQTNIGTTLVVPKGTTRHFLVAGNMAASLTAYAGQAPSIAVVAINTTANVSGSLPITGASQTTNASLSVGTVTLSTSNAYAVNANSTQNIGTTGYRFTGYRLTAGSAEDIRLRSITWNQTGSVSATDLANVVTVVNGTSYPTTVSADGKYLYTSLGSGVVVTKGNSVEVYVQGDIVGSNASGRTIILSVDKTTDVFATGETYGYGISPAAPSSHVCATDNTVICITEGSPYVYGASVTVTGASVTTIAKDSGVPAQNIAVNVPNQTLGGFAIDLKGEGISVQSQIFNIATTSGAMQLTNVTLVDQNGSVVAGPVDSVYTGSGASTVTFTDTVTYGTGRHTYSLRGKVATDSSNGGTYVVSTTPSSWSNPKGATSGNSVSLSSNGAFSMNTMTIKAAGLAVSISSTPATQNIVAGAQGFTFANVQLDASQSGDDVRVTSVPLTENNAGGSFAGSYAYLTTCQLFDGTTALNSGGNIVNPTGTATSTPKAASFVFDNPVLITKGTTKTLALRCNLSSSANTNSTFAWGITTTQAGAVAASGVNSGSTIVPTGATNNGQIMTVSGAGTVVATTDSQSPAYAIAASGSTGVTLGAYRLSAANEDVLINRIGVSLGLVTASSSAADVSTVYLYSGSTLLGSVSFNGSNRNATTTLSTPLTIPRDSSVTITVKGDLATQGASQASHPGALLTVDIDNSTNTQGVGVQSGSTVNVTGTTAVAGVRVFRSYPSVSRSTTGMGSTLVAQSGVDLYRFSVTANNSANGNGLALNKITVNIATSSVSTANGTTTVTNLKVFAYTGSDFQTGPAAGFTAGQVNTTAAGAYNGDNVVTFTSPLSFAAGQTYYFRVVGDITQIAGTTGSAGSVTTKLTGDTSYPSLSTLLGSATGLASNFVWSPLSTSTNAVTGSLDWTNGYNIPGISSGSSDAWTLTK